MHTLKGKAETRQVWLDGELLDLQESLKVRRHSPDGFSWGYNGAGPAQLALAVVLKLRGKGEGYQEFKQRVIALLPLGQDFEIEFEL